MVTVKVVLGTPFNNSLTRWLVAWETSIVSIAKIQSPTFKPAFAAGIPSVGSEIITRPFESRWRITEPIPPYSPVVIRRKVSISLSG